MIRRNAILTLVLATALAMTIPAADASARTPWAFFGVAGTGPVSDFGEFANVGWMLNGGVMFPIGEGRWSAGGGLYIGGNPHETDGDKTRLTGINALVGYSLTSNPEASVRPFLFLGTGYMNNSYKSENNRDLEDSQGSVASTGGIGFTFSASQRVGITAFGSYSHGFGNNDGIRFGSLGANVQIPFGGS